MEDLKNKRICECGEKSIQNAVSFEFYGVLKSAESSARSRAVKIDHISMNIT